MSKLGVVTEQSGRDGILYILIVASRAFQPYLFMYPFAHKFTIGRNVIGGREF